MYRPTPEAPRCFRMNSGLRRSHPRGECLPSAGGRPAAAVRVLAIADGHGLAGDPDLNTGPTVAAAVAACRHAMALSAIVRRPLFLIRSLHPPDSASTRSLSNERAT